MQNKEYEEMQTLIKLNLRFHYGADYLNGLEVLPDWGKLSCSLTQVWESICFEMQARKRERNFYLPVAVKVTSTQLQECGIAQSLGMLCRKYHIPEGTLHIELAETEFQEENKGSLKTVIPELQQQGIYVTLDEFGSGCLSLNILKTFDFNAIKIDIRNFGSFPYSEKERVIMEAVIQMAAGLKIPITAKGIGSAQEASFVMRIGCLYQTGSYFSRELKMEELSSILLKYQEQNRIHSTHDAYHRVEEVLKKAVFNPFLYENIIQHLPAPVVVYQTGKKTEIIMLNQPAEELSGYIPEEFERLLHQDVMSIIPWEDVKSLKAQIESIRQSEEGTLNTTFRFIQKDGEICHLTMQANVLGRYQENVVFLAILTDVTKQKRWEKELRTRAEFDMLTGVYNRGTIEDKIRKVLKRQRQEEASGAMFIIDIDNFKKINDTIGHGAGDRALGMIGEKIKRLFRKSDVYGRMGGDEFIIYMNEINSRESVIMKAEQIIRELQFEMICGDAEPVTVTCSIGVVISPEHGETFEDLYERADSAVYQAKKQGKNMFALWG